MLWLETSWVLENFPPYGPSPDLHVLKISTQAVNGNLIALSQETFSHFLNEFVRAENSTIFTYVTFHRLPPLGLSICLTGEQDRQHRVLNRRVFIPPRSWGDPHYKTTNFIVRESQLSDRCRTYEIHLLLLGLWYFCIFGRKQN